MNYNTDPGQTHDLRVEIPPTFSNELTLLINVDPTSINTAVVDDYARAHGFEPKADYHLTVIGSRDVVQSLRQRLAPMTPEMQKDLRTKLDQLIELLGHVRLKDGRYYHLVKHYDYGETPEMRETIIQEADIEGIDDFYAGFLQVAGIELGTPFPHVTLYTKGTSEEHTKGIGVPSVEAFEAMEHTPIAV